jgi:hypothetical protein
MPQTNWPTTHRRDGFRQWQLATRLLRRPIARRRFESRRAPRWSGRPCDMSLFAFNFVFPLYPLWPHCQCLFSLFYPCASFQLCPVLSLSQSQPSLFLVYIF